MVTGPPLLLVISVPSSLGLGVVRALNATEGQIGTTGAAGVMVGTGVKVNVDVGGTGVLVRVGGRGVGVDVLGPLEGVQEGITKPVIVGGKVAEGIGVRVSVVIEVGVKVISL
jgi:hypothetical protein